MKQTETIPSASYFFVNQVAGAGYGLDHIAAMDILKAIRSTNGFAVAIILKPFSFEGQRRLDEVSNASKL